MTQPAITIIDYKVGNLLSVKNILKKVGAANVKISGDPNEIMNSDKLILPGVGHFDYGMNKLQASGLIPVIKDQVVLKNKPILGICLGAQLMTKKSSEGIELGLGLIDGETIAFDKNKLEDGMKIPHMSWNYVKEQKSTPLFLGMHPDPRFYFVHSYHMQMSDNKDVWLTTEYGYEFCSAFQRDNIYGCQFHPEKSHKFGMKIFDNFVKL